VQALPSLQVIPSGTALCTQPRVGSQLSAVQRFPSSQPRGPAPWHTPRRQLSPTVQGLPSLHANPSGTALFTQAPLTALQLSAVQRSPWVHGSPSSQGAPSASGVEWQTPLASQASAVHGLPSSQDGPTPAHRPAVQVSLFVQVLPSSQAVPSGSTPCLQTP